MKYKKESKVMIELNDKEANYLRLILDKYEDKDPFEVVEFAEELYNLLNEI